ncbi:hypothetical protein ACS0TY_008371 [Phlomoides rotata]
MRQWKAGPDSWDGSAAVGIGGAVAAALLSLFLIIAVLFSCAGGASEDKDSPTSHADTYAGSACVAACGGACGG